MWIVKNEKCRVAKRYGSFNERMEAESITYKTHASVNCICLFLTPSTIGNNGGTFKVHLSWVANFSLGYMYQASAVMNERRSTRLKDLH